MVELNKTVHVSQLCWRILLLRLAVLVCSKTRYHVDIKSEMKANSTSGGDVLSFCSTWPLASFHYRNSYHMLFFCAFVLKPEVTKAASSFFCMPCPNNHPTLDLSQSNFLFLTHLAQTTLLPLTWANLTLSFWHTLPKQPSFPQLEPV